MSNQPASDFYLMNPLDLEETQTPPDWRWQEQLPPLHWPSDPWERVVMYTPDAIAQ